MFSQASRVEPLDGANYRQDHEWEDDYGNDSYTVSADDSIYKTILPRLLSTDASNDPQTEALLRLAEHSC